MRKTIIASIIALMSAGLPMAGELAGHPQVIDGDTLKLNGKRVRLVGMDAPEMDQDYGNVARVTLVTIIGKGSVSCQTDGLDRYNRILAKCSINGADIGRQMVRRGMAFSYWTDDYDVEEAQARRDRRGVWFPEAPMRPSVWRKLKRLRLE